MAPVTDYFDADLFASCMKITQDSRRPKVNDLTVGFIFFFHLSGKVIHRVIMFPLCLRLLFCCRFPNITIKMVTAMKTSPFSFFGWCGQQRPFT